MNQQDQNGHDGQNPTTIGLTSEPKELVKESSKCVGYTDRQVKPKTNRKSSKVKTGKDMLAYMERIRNRDDSNNLAEINTHQKQACRSHSSKAILHPEGTTADSNSGVTFEKLNLSKNQIQAQGNNENIEVGTSIQPSESLGSQGARINSNSRNQGIKKFMIQTSRSPSEVKQKAYKPETPNEHTQSTDKTKTSVRPEEGFDPRSSRNKPG